MTHPAVRAYGAWATLARRTWRGEVARSFLSPALYLGAMGVGLGSYVKSGGGQAQLGGHTYVTFIAPGLLAATAMQTAAGESSWPVLGSIKWWKRYHAMLATPLRVRDVLLGHLAWMATWLTVVCAVFLGVMAAFGVLPHPSSVLVLPAAVLTGMAFATPIAAFAATRETDAGFALLFRFGVVPLFLFSGTFFPVDQLPAGIRPIAWITPLWHGVDLCRSLVLGGGRAWLIAVHVCYLVALLVAGLALAQRTYTRRLRV
jgi:lipooligosaccharide transport system permease protein